MKRAAQESERKHGMDATFLEETETLVESNLASNIQQVIKRSQKKPELMSKTPGHGKIFRPLIQYLVFTTLQEFWYA